MPAELTPTEDALPARTEALLAEFSQAAERKYRHDKQFQNFFKIGALSYIGCQLFVCYVRWMYIPLPFAVRVAIVWLFKISLIPVALNMLPVEVLFWKREKQRRERFEALIQELSEDPRAIGAIAQTCRNTRFLLHSDLAIQTLVKLLPQIKASDARYFSDSQMEALLDLLVLKNQNALSSQRSAELPLAILKALEQIGDSRAVGPVRRLTTGRRNRRYHQAAQECLVFLEQHGDDRDYTRSLLLPASTEAGQETLLRAAGQQAETQPELLLRVVHDEERG